MRNSTYFIGTDTIKEPGLPAILVPGLIDYAAWRQVMVNGLQKKNDLKDNVDVWMKDLANFMSSQSIEDNKRLTPFTVNAE